MKSKTLLFLIGVALVVAGVQKSSGATVPQGTILVVRTARAVSSVDSRGRAVPFRLARPITVDGKIAIAAGTHLSGKVITSRQLASSNDQLTVDLTSVHLAGRNVLVATTGPQVLSNNIRTMGGVSISRSNYTVATGKSMQFQLARPLVF